MQFKDVNQKIVSANLVEGKQEGELKGMLTNFVQNASG